MEYYMPTRVINEADCVSNHPEVFRLGTKAMIVTGHSSSKKNGSLDDITKVLDGEGIPYVLYDRVEENPSIETVMDAREVGLAEGVDFVIGVGGGSSMDAAKAIAMMIAHPEHGAEVLYDRMELDYIPVIAVPTTAGTGSEVTPWAILTIHEKRTKSSIPHKIFPAVALVDAKYFKSIPRKVLVSTAVDTLAHLVESHLVTRSDTYSKIFSKKGLEFWGAFKDALAADAMEDADYENMIHACSMGGIAITHTGTGLPHALSYMVTYETGLPHGLACGYSLGGFLATYNDEGMIAEVLEALGFERAEDFCAYLDTLMGELPVEAELWETNAKAMIKNVGKRMTYPYRINADKIYSWGRF